VVRLWRTCSYCGSIHPEDLLGVLERGARMHGCDWKYGHPHKHYLDIPNPEPKRLFIATVGPGDKVIRGTRSHLFGKWYNEHLRELDDEAFAAVAAALQLHTDIAWTRDADGVVKYIAPRYGHQR
jgi:hypothetical protein